jgi:ketosteroid isomerase-like protein
MLAVAALVAVAASLALGQMTNKPEKTKGRNAKVEQLLIKMERDGNAATVKKDIATLDKLLADDWIGQSPAGTQTKAQVLGDLKSEDQRFDSITLSDMKVRVFGNTAVVTGSQDVKSSYQGKDTSGRYRWIDVFVKRQARWQDAFSQMTPITK